MAEVVGTIKITEFKIITKKNGKTEIWSLTHGDDSKFIVYKGQIYKFVSEEGE